MPGSGIDLTFMPVPQGYNGHFSGHVIQHVMIAGTGIHFGPVIDGPQPVPENRPGNAGGTTFVYCSPPPTMGIVNRIGTPIPGIEDIGPEVQPLLHRKFPGP